MKAVYKNVLAFFDFENVQFIGEHEPGGKIPNRDAGIENRHDPFNKPGVAVDYLVIIFLKGTLNHCFALLYAGKPSLRAALYKIAKVAVRFCNAVPFLRFVIGWAEHAGKAGLFAVIRYYR